MRFRVLGLAGLVCLGIRAGAQAQAVVAGMVMDTAGKPLAGAEIVALKAKRQVRSDAGGRFLLTGLAKGADIFQVHRVGFRPQSFNLDLQPGDTLRVGVTLGRDTLQVLPELTVSAATLAQRRLEEIRERILRSGAPPSALVSREELDHTNATRLSPILLAHGLKARVNARGKDALVCPRQNGRPAVYLDGALVDGGESNGAKAYRTGNPFDNGPFDLENFSPDEVEAIEVYTTTAERPAQFNQTGSSCVVVIWLKRGG